MAIGKKTGGRDFTLGNNANPEGRPKLPDDLKELKRLNQMELERALNELLLLTPVQLKKIKDDPESTMLQLLIVSIITHGTNKGDHMRMGFLLDRLLGKMKENVHVELHPFKDLSDEELNSKIKEAESALDPQGT